MSRFTFPILSIIGACVATGSPALADPPQYALRYLGEAAKIEGINASGVITGWRLSPSPARSFVAGADQPYTLLPLPAGYTSSLTWDINDAGVVVGEVLGVSQGMAAAWYPDGQGGYTIELLGTLPGHVQSIAYAINNQGQIVGDSIIPGWPGGPTVWFNSPSGVIDLGPDAPSRPTAINDNGLVVGWGFAMFDLGEMAGVPLPPGGGGLIWGGNNNHNDLCGFTSTSSETIAAVRWTETFGWLQLGGSINQSAQYAAYDINDSHVTVGKMVGGSIYFDDYGLLNLHDLIAPEYSNWSLDPGFSAINNAGQIAIFASNQSTQIGGVALLTPLGEMIIPGDVNGDAWVDLDDHCAWQAAPIDLDSDGDADADDEQWLIDRLAGLGLIVADCNGNGLGDHCDIVAGTSLDCDGNGVADECQADCNGDGVPDVCEPDCNANGTPDPCDIAGGASDDCNANGIPDECDGGGVTQVTIVHDPSIQMLQGTTTVEEALVVDAGIIDDVDLQLDVRYRLGDMTMRLAHNGTTVTILDRPGYPQYASGFVNFGYDAIVDDEGTGPFLENAGDFCCDFEWLLSPPSYRPDNPFSVFDGMPSEGVWTLTIITEDHWSPGEGLLGWGLTIRRAAVPVPPCECPADLDGSGGVGFVDVLAVIGAWGPCGPDCPEDVNGNGSVDFADVLMVIGAWGPC